MKDETEMMQPDREAIEARLPKIRRRLDQFRQGWLWLEQMDRCLRQLRDPEAAVYFHQAAPNYPPREEDPGDQIRLGNYTAWPGRSRQRC